MIHSSKQLLTTIALHDLFPSASYVGCADISVSHITQRSDRCELGSTFAVISGTKENGAAYVNEAIRYGARSLIVEQAIGDCPLPQCVVPDVRIALATICNALAENPTQKLKTVGVTGTNGKTTVSWLVCHLCRAVGYQTGLLGTIEYSDGLDSSPAHLTTPETEVLFEWFSRMVQQKSSHAVMEISSHALDQNRTACAKLDAALLLNISHDHLDYHENLESYAAAKFKILDHLKQDSGVCFLNLDDSQLRRWFQSQQGRFPIRTFSCEREADLSATVIHESLTGQDVQIHWEEQTYRMTYPLIGKHNLSNALAAMSAGLHLGIPIENLLEGLQGCTPPPGRLERICLGQPFPVFVDYAHTEDALKRAICTLKPLVDGRLICLFGAGGDRDREKRPRMAQAASLADYVIVTSDNPRTEEPNQIIQDVMNGFQGTFHAVCNVNRRAAIQHALEIAEPGDCILIAGKGHERFQMIGQNPFPFNDRRVVEETLMEMGYVSEKICA